MKARLRDVIPYLVYNGRYPPAKTSLMKLVYMADYYYWQLHGEQMTDCEYKLGRYGAVCYKIPETAQLMDGKELRLTLFLFGSGYQLNYQIGPEPIANFNISNDCKEVLDFVIARHSEQNLLALKRSHYSTEPMQTARIRGEKLRMSTIERKLRTKDHPRLKALQKLVNEIDFETKGSAEERAEHRAEIMEALSPARKRASTLRLEGSG